MTSQETNETRPLIVSAKIDDKAQQFFNAKREQHFPPERNYLDAHLTLFHKLPAEEIETIKSQLEQAATQTPIIQAKTTDIMFMGFGSAYIIEAPDLCEMRKKLAQKWQMWLTPQDKNRFKPHVTFQNKVKANIAEELYKTEKEIFEPFNLGIIALSLWHYNNGPWQHIKNYPLQK